MTDSPSVPGAPAGRLARTLLLLAGTVLLLTPVLALLYRAGLLDLATALGGVGLAAGFGVLVLLLALVTAALGWRRNSTADIALAGLAFFVALVPVAVVGGNMYAASMVPRIHDITTDPDNPPVLVGIGDQIPERSLSYAGDAVYAQQAEAYPDIESLILPTDPIRSFQLLQAEVEARGWQVTLSDPEEGHLEAVDTSLWFGFKDDIVVRIQPYPTGSLVDARSVSRVGESDLGVNARRIRDLFAALRERAGA